MSFSAEIKDFVSGFQAGAKLFPRESEYSRRRREDQEGLRDREDDPDLLDPKDAGSRAASTDEPDVALPGVPYRSTPTSQLGNTGIAPRNASLQEKADRSIPAIAANAGQQYGISPSYMKTTALVESGANPRAVSPTGAAGPYQFTRGTAAAYKLANKTDWGASSDAAARLAADNRDKLARSLGRTPTDREVYLAHQSGSGGAVALLRNPSRSALEALTEAHRGNRARAAQAIRVNGGRTDMTAGEFGNLQMRKYDRSRVSELDEEEILPEELQRRALPVQFAAMGGAIEDPRRWEDPPVRVVSPEVTAVVVPPEEEVTALQEVPLPPQRPSEAALVVARPRRPAPAPVAADEAPTRPQGALPVRQGAPAAAPQPAARPGQAPWRGAYPVNQGVDTDSMTDLGTAIAGAIDSGLDAISKFFGFGEDDAPTTQAIPQANPQSQARLTAFNRNEGAATREEVAQVNKTIDPEGRMSADALALRRLYAGYRYFQEKGEMGKAANYAKSMLLYTRERMQEGGAQAEQALQNGDVPGAAEAIQKSHNELPDGQTIKIGKVGPNGAQFEMYDENGDLTQRGEANVNQMMQMAVNMRNGTEWFRQMGLIRNNAPKLSAAAKLKEQREREADAAGDRFDMSGAEQSDFMNSLTPEQRAEWPNLDPKRQNARFQRWREEGKRAMSERRTSNSEQQAATRNEMAERKQTAAEKKRELEDQNTEQAAVHIGNISAAQDELMRAQQTNDTAVIAEAQKNYEAARAEARKWAGEGPGRAKHMIPMRLTPSATPQSKEPQPRPDLSPEAAKIDVEHRKHFKRPTPDQLNARATEVSTRMMEKVGLDTNGASPERANAFRNVVMDIMGSNDITADQAIDIVRGAVSGAQPGITPTNQVRFGNAPPVRISPESLTIIDRFRQKAPAAAPAAAPAVPTTSQPNPFQRKELDDDTKAVLDRMR